MVEYLPMKKDIFLSLLSGLLLILSFPNFNLWFLAWFALVPLFFAIENQGPFKAFLIAYLTGVLFFLGTIYWLIHVTLPGMVFSVLYLALYFGIFGLVLTPSPKPQAPSLFLAPAAWTALEWLRSNGTFGFGWVLLGHSQSQNLPIIQISDYTGAYGVSFLIIAVNSAIFLTIRNFNKRKASALPVLLVGFLVFISLAYGYLRLNNIFTGERLKVSVVQGNIPQEVKWNDAFREEIINRYEALTRKAAENKPDLIIWPETSVPGFLESEKDLFERVKGLVISIDTPLLVGTVREKKGSNGVNYYNSAILFSNDGRILDIYDKVHLVPFGEYIPFKKALSFVEKFAPVPIGDCSAGRVYKVFSFFIERGVKDKDVNWKLLKKVKFSSLICFEDIFPGLTREFVKNGAGFLVNITNDAWYKKSSAPYQHAQNSVFRAVENRTNIIRAANTGASCYIDQKGRIAGLIETKKDGIFVAGFKSHEIVLSRIRTFYTTYGDVFAYLCIIYIVFCIINGWRGARYLL